MCGSSGLGLQVSSATPVLLCILCLFLFVFYAHSGIKLRCSCLLDRMHCADSQAPGHKTLHSATGLHLLTQFLLSWWTQQDNEVFETPSGHVPICCSFLALRKLLQSLMRHEVGQDHSARISKCIQNTENNQCGKKNVI